MYDLLSLCQLKRVKGSYKDIHSFCSSCAKNQFFPVSSWIPILLWHHYQSLRTAMHIKKSPGHEVTERKNNVLYRLADSRTDPEIYHSGYAGQTTNALFALILKWRNMRTNLKKKKAREIFLGHSCGVFISLYLYGHSCGVFFGIHLHIHWNWPFHGSVISKDFGSNLSFIIAMLFSWPTRSLWKLFAEMKGLQNWFWKEV